MAAAISEPGRKRPIPTKIAAMKARKRRKVDGEDQQPLPSKSKKVDKPKNHAVKVDALPWKTVTLPDRLDDYEGFYNLEEIDDVDVVKDIETGRISFASHLAQDSAPDGKDDLVPDDEDGEWSGFDDENDAPKLISISKSTRTLAHPRKGQPTNKNEGFSYNGSFDSLDNEPYDDGDEVDVSAWSTLGLSSNTLQSLSKLQFSKPTPIQRDAIPEALAGHDVIGKASTGSGKTLAFGIPILEHFLEKRGSKVPSGQKAPLALILSPTRELAHQLDKHLTALCNGGSFDGPTIATLTGGLSVQKQQRMLETADIVVGTPGRLWEVMSDGQGVLASMKHIKVLVIDEADRLLSQGNYKELEEILNALDRQEDTEHSKSLPTSDRQTLVFSATFDKGLQRKLNSKAPPTTGNNLLSNKESMEYLLQKLNFREPKPNFIDVNPLHPLVTGLRESLVECPAGTNKDLYLYTLLLLLSNNKSSQRTLIFTNSISAVKRLTPFLQNLNLPAMALHSGMPQKARMRSVERFTSGQDSSCSILVATDVAARGLDIPDVQVVMHYHLPRAADTYVHRSGRTARAGQSGSSILICAPEEVASVRRLVAKVHAASTSGDDTKAKSYIRTMDLNRKIVSRLRPRAALAKKLADTQIAKGKQSKEDDFMRAAAEELGVDYDSDTFAADEAKGKRGRGAGRKKKEKESAELTKAEVSAIRAELKSLLKQRVNVGVSERYLTSGGVDVDELLRQYEEGIGKYKQGHDFLGSVGSLDLEDL